MSSDSQHEHLVAERAAFWCSRLPHSDLAMRREFVRWLKQSPAHVREMLCANALDLELGKFDPERRINIDALFARAANNVMPLQSKRPINASEAIADRVINVCEGNDIGRRRWIYSITARLVAACATAAALLFSFHFQAPRDAHRIENPQVVTSQADSQETNLAADRVTDTIPPPPPPRR